MKLKYKDKTYNIIDENFPLAYPNHTVWFMYEEGNYSCDCNKSSFIKRQRDPQFPEMECGDEVELVDLIITYEKRK